MVVGSVIVFVMSLVIGALAIYIGARVVASVQGTAASTSRYDGVASVDDLLNSHFNRVELFSQWREDVRMS